METGSVAGPEVWSVTGSYPFKKAVGSYNKGFASGNIPNVAPGEVSSQTVNTPGPKRLILLYGATGLFSVLLRGEDLAFFGNLNGEEPSGTVGVLVDAFGVLDDIFISFHHGAAHR